MYESVAEIGGRHYYVLVPDHEQDATKGMILGPPDLSSLELPPEVEERLHLELFVRGIKNKQIAMRRRQEVFSALQAAFALSTDKIVECYSNA